MTIPAFAAARGPVAPVIPITLLTVTLAIALVATGSGMVAGALWLVFAVACGYSISGSV